MAGYSTINAQFRPLSYQEMLAPVTQADTEHKTIEEQQGQLDALVGQWETKLANEEEGSPVRKVYQKYIDELHKQSALLSNKGLDISSRKELTNLKARYGTDITPIAEAYKKQQEEIQRRQTLSDKDASYIFEGKVGSINDYYTNPNLQHKSLRTNEIYETAAKDFENMSKNITSYGNWENTAAGKYIQRLHKIGYTPQEITRLISQDENAPKELKDLYNNILSKYQSIGNWSPEGNTSIKQALDRGASYGIGSIDYDVKENPQWALDHTGQQTNPFSGNIPLDFHSLTSPDVQGSTGTNAVAQVKSLLQINENGNAPTTMQVSHNMGRSTDLVGLRAGDTTPSRIFDKDGRMLTKYQFIQEFKKNLNNKDSRYSSPIAKMTGADERVLENASMQYDKVAQSLKAIGIDVETLAKQGKVPTLNIINKAMKEVQTQTGALQMSAVKLNFGNNNDAVFESGILPDLLLANGETALKEISSFDNEGTFKLSNRIVKADEFMDDKGKLIGHPTYYATPTVKQDGLVILFNGKTYLAPKGKLGSIFNSSETFDIPTLTEANAARDALIKQFGYSTYINSVKGQELENTIDQAGAGYTRTISRGIAGYYKLPTTDLDVNSEKGFY